MAALTSIQTGFAAGEISPELYGRVDLAKWRQGSSTLRNMCVSYRGPAFSRAGLAYVGTCKQLGTSAPPRDIRFQFSLNQSDVLEFGDQYMRVKTNGAYVTEGTKAISGATRANPCVITITAHGYSVGDWIAITGMTGMTNFNGLVWIVSAITTNTVTLKDLFGGLVNSTSFNAYVSGGTAARIYTITTPYAAVDLPYLKYTQSANTMTLTCVNTATNTEYPPYDLVRNGASNWALSAENFGATITAPTSITVTANNSTTKNTFYGYVVTAVDANGQESLPSVMGTAENNDIAVNAGSNAINWTQVTGATSYNIYKAPPAYNVAVPVGAVFGYIGSSIGNQFVDTNITADFTTVPPSHQDPFARGQILYVTIGAGGTSYTQATVGYTVGTSTGSGFAGTPVVVGGAVVGFFVTTPGKNFQSGDTITITDSGTGTGATAMLKVGPNTGTYPGTVAYFQQRRAYANTLNNPNTYYMTKPGEFLNMDSSIPLVADDAIIGTPWSQQINGIQFMVPMPSGLVVLTGLGAWQLTGGTSAAFTAIDQNATPQAYNGCSALLEPVTVNYDILYVQSKGSIVRDLSYNFFVNIYTGTDLTVLSNHLFSNHSLLRWAYAEEPFKIIWAVRDDGAMLSLTYLKEQDVYGWSRHDTNGFFQCVVSVTEPPVDAIYVITRRFVRGQWMYYSERMDNRNWPTVENAFCVDAGLSLPLTFPNATLTPAATNGTNNISGTQIITGGTGYTAPVITANDPAGTGSGATFSATLSGGVITAITPLTQGQNYSTGAWNLTITDATGTGAMAQPIVTNIVAFTASSAVFNSGMVGNVIRAGVSAPSTSGAGAEAMLPGAGKAAITSFVSSTQVMANVIKPFLAVQDDPNNTPVPATSGNWSMGIPQSTVFGLNHLEGLTVSILADGNVMPPQVVTNGQITLPAAYSMMAVGLPFTAQMQTLYLEPPAQQMTNQTKRKNIFSAGIRVASTRGLKIGTNQPDQAAQPNNTGNPVWTNLVPVKERPGILPAGVEIPLFTGDEFINVPAGWDTRGQVALQQDNPLPCTVLALVSYFQPGDSPPG